MEELRRFYSHLCKESGAEPQEAVLRQLHQAPQGRLDLAGQSLTVDTCRALGKLLQNQTVWSELVLSDCMLSEEEQAVDHNQDQHTVFQENQARTHILSKEVQHLQEEKSKQFVNLMETIDKQREEMAKSSRAVAVRVGQLQEALNERHSIIKALKAKLQMTEATLALSDQKAQDLGELLATAEQEHRLGQQEAAERESKLLRDLSATNEKNLLLRNQVDELEQKVKSQQEQLFLIRQELTHTSAELRMQAVQAEERLDMEKRRAQQSLEDSEKLHSKEVPS